MTQLEKHSKSNPFKVPEGYFEGIEEEILTKVKLEPIDGDNSWKISSLKPFLAIAAGFLLIFSLWFVFLNKIGKNEFVSNNEPGEEELIYSFLGSIDSDELIHLIANNNFENNKLEIDLEKDADFALENLNESLIIDEIEQLD